MTTTTYDRMRRPGRSLDDDGLLSDLVRYANLDPADPRRRPLRTELVAAYLPLAERLARRFASRGEPLDDLVQVATIGLIHAIDRFQPDVGSGFLAFAVPTIKGELRRHFRDRGWSMRVPRPLKELHLSINDAVDRLSQQLERPPRPSELAGFLDVSREEIIAALEAGQAYRATSLDAPSAPDADDATVGEQLGGLDPALEFVEEQNSLRPLLDKLPERERTIVLLRFYGNMTQSEIAGRIGLSQMQISRLLSHTLSWLRGELRG